MEHRVGNDLFVVSGVLSRGQRKLERLGGSEYGAHVLRQAKERVAAMGEVHSLLAEGQQGSGMREYFTRIVNRLAESRGVTPRLQSVFPNDFPMSLERSVSCGRMLYELVANAIEHGGREDDLEVTVILEKNDVMNEFFLAVRDNGDASELAKMSSLADGTGLDIVRRVAESLEGELLPPICDANGTTMQVRFPSL